ncbi:MAG: shikimate dehydrogenase [Kordiimonas sp.]
MIEGNLLPSGRATLCISVAQKPSSFGITVHNAGYRHLGLDYFYKAFQADKIEPVLAAVRTLGIRGCSVSMPFKVDVIPMLDDLDTGAQKVGAVNTIVNNDGRLTGYNTDVVGAVRALKTLKRPSLGKVLVLGGGGVARAVLTALSEFETDGIIVALRRPEAGEHLKQCFPVEITPWDQRHSVPTNLLINASPIGMAPEMHNMPVDGDFVVKLDAVMDVVATPAETRLISASKQIGKPFVSGLTMTLYQAAEQFQIYTGHEAPIDVMRDAYQQLEGNKP